MAQFYADIQGNKGMVTRMGTKKSGLDGHIRGWYVGARVWMSFNEETQEDECTIDLTGGSSRGGSSKRLGTFTAKDI